MVSRVASALPRKAVSRAVSGAIFGVRSHGGGGAEGQVNLRATFRGALVGCLDSMRLGLLGARAGA